jgi:uncharacterized membrane protein YqjE
MAEPESGGWLATLRRLRDSALGLARTRLELFALELQEEKLRTINVFAWVAAALTLGAAGLLALIGTLALFVWRTAGYAGLAGLGVLLLAAAVAIFWRVRRAVLEGPPPFSATIAEFQKDLQ